MRGEWNHPVHANWYMGSGEKGVGGGWPVLMIRPALKWNPSPLLCPSPGPGSELFSLHPHSGELLTAAPLIRAERPHYVLTLSAHDQGSPPRSSSLQLLVQVWLPFLQSIQVSLATNVGTPSQSAIFLSPCALSSRRLL